ILLFTILFAIVITVPPPPARQNTFPVLPVPATVLSLTVLLLIVFVVVEPEPPPLTNELPVIKLNPLATVVFFVFPFSRQFVTLTTIPLPEAIQNVLDVVVFPLWMLFCIVSKSKVIFVTPDVP